MSRPAAALEQAASQVAGATCGRPGGSNALIRNRPAWERGQRLRQHIRALLASRSQLEPAIGAKRIRQHLERIGWQPLPGVGTIRWHIQALRQEYVVTSRNVSDTQ